MVGPVVVCIVLLLCIVFLLARRIKESTPGSQERDGSTSRSNVLGLIEPSPHSPTAQIPEVETPNVVPRTFEFQLAQRARGTSGSSLLPNEFVVLDLETTGLSPASDEIIEIGAIRLSRCSDQHTVFQRFVKPTCRLSGKITEITGITEGTLNAYGRHLPDSLAEFIYFIGDCPLVTFNAPFDMGFIWNAARKCGVSVNNPYACALQWSRRAWPGLPSHRLVDLARMRKLPTDDSHRALGDCGRTVHLFVSAVESVGERIIWSTPPVNWRVQSRYNGLRLQNRTFVSETRPLEVSDPTGAASRYFEALAKMYEYEKLIFSRTGDDFILDRLTLVLGKLGRYQELVSTVDEFVLRFPDAGGSQMTTILKRKMKADSKLKPTR